MAQEKIEPPKFKGDDDEFSIWFWRAKAYTVRFGFAQAMSATAEANLPRAEGPGANADEQAAVERNLKAVFFLSNAVPDSMLVNVTAAGLKDAAWPAQPKAHLMIAYLVKSFRDTTALAGVGVIHDLDDCKMKDDDDDPKLIFEKLVGVQFKHRDNPEVQITERDLVTRAIQALPIDYTSSIAALIDAERRAGRALTLDALKQAAKDYYAVARKGKEKVKVKEIEGGLVATDEPSKMQGNLEKVIEETIQCTIREFRSNPTGGGYGNHHQPHLHAYGPRVDFQGNGGLNYGGPSAGTMLYHGRTGGGNYGSGQGPSGAMNYGGQGSGVNYGGLGGGAPCGAQGGGMMYGGQVGANVGMSVGMNVGMNGGQGAGYGGQGVGVNYGGQGVGGNLSGFDAIGTGGRQNFVSRVER
jgi:hypothetical protein